MKSSSAYLRYENARHYYRFGARCRSHYYRGVCDSLVRYVGLRRLLPWRLSYSDRETVYLHVRTSLCIFLSLISLSAFAQPRCEVMQFMGTDSAHPSLAHLMVYNERGQTIRETFKGYYETPQQLTTDGEYTYFYNDTFLTRWAYSSYSGDSSRLEFKYDANGRLIQQSLFELKAIGNDRGIYNGTGTASPRRWEQTSLVNFTYDDKGNKILFDATRLHNSPQNMYKWEYDEKNRVVKHESYSRGKLTWKEDYQYFDWGYRFWRTWYDFDGNMRHEFSQESPQYYPLLFFTYKLDKQGRIIEERITDEKQKLQGRTVTFYGNDGRISRTLYYDANDQQSVTHIYNYYKQ